MNWSIIQDGDQWIVKQGDEVIGEAYDSPAAALAAMDDLMAAAEAPADVEMPECSPGRWSAPILVPAHGTTGDGRRFMMAGAGWRVPPLAMMFQSTTEVGHFGAEWSGTVTRVFFNDDGSIGAEGFYAANDAGQAHHDAVAAGMRGISMDASAEEYEIEGLDACDECEDPGDPMIVFTRWSIMGFTGTPFPAFAEAYMENEDQATTASVGESGPEFIVPATLSLGGNTFTPTTSTITINVGAGDNAAATAAEVAKALTAGATGNAVTDGAWDGDLTRFSAEELRVASAACGDAGSEESCILPHHEPDGIVSRAGVHRAAQQFANIKASAQVKDQAAAHLRAHYANDLNEEAPQSITNHSRATKAADEDVVTAEAVVACAAADLPPAAWFEDPKLDGPTRLTVTSDGRVFGHAAYWRNPRTGQKMCHIGMKGCTEPPHSQTGYAYFNRIPVTTAEGTTVLAGKLTMDGPHAERNWGPARAAAHYDDTHTAAANIRAGEDEHGIWVAGALCRDMTEEDVRRVNTSDVSGDWRPLEGGSELVALQAVNVAGFPQPALVAGADEAAPYMHVEWARMNGDGEVLALVASAGLPPMREPTEVEVLTARVARLEKLMGHLRGVTASAIDRAVDNLA